jgi:DNA-3-methyladenine glycosylase
MPEGIAEAVLVRAGEIVEGRDLARSRRSASRGDVDLARGPGRLARALELTLALDGADLCDPDGPLRLEPGEPVDRALISSGPRTGISRAADLPWRFHVHGDPTVSPYRRAAAAGPAPSASPAAPAAGRAGSGQGR